MQNSTDFMPRLERFSNSKFCALLAEKFPESGYGVRADFTNVSHLAHANVERVIDHLSRPFKQRRSEGLSYSFLCPELVINGNAGELARDLVGVCLYFQIASRFGEDEHYQSLNQYKAMVKAARERERNDSRNLPGGRTFAVDSVLKFWVDLPGWPKNNTFKRIFQFLFVSACHCHYDMNFDEGYGGTIRQPVWMSLVHCVRSFYGVFGAIDFDDFPTRTVERITNAAFRTEEFLSNQGVDPWLELHKRRREDLFGGVVNQVFPGAPVAEGESTADSARQRVTTFLETCRRARIGFGSDDSPHGNSGPRRSRRVPVPRRVIFEMAPDVLRPRPMACERRVEESSDSEMDTNPSASSNTSGSSNTSSRPASVVSPEVSVADPMRVPVAFSDVVPAGVQRPVASSNANVAEVSGESSAEEEIPADFYVLPVTDEEAGSAYVPMSSVSSSPVIGSSRRRSRPIISDDE